MSKKILPRLIGGGFLNIKLFSLALCLNAPGAGFNAFAIKNCVLQIRKQSYNRRPHRVGTLYGAGISFTAIKAHSGHKIS